MGTNIISKRYAKAFFADIKPEEIDTLLQDISVLKKVADKHLIEILQAPIISLKEKYKIIKDITQNLHFAEKWSNFLDIMGKKQRLKYLPTVLDELEKMVYRSQNKQKVILYLAHQESDEIIKKIEDKISKLLSSEIVSEIIIDPKILGGFIAETEKYHIDGSIQGNLIRLKNLIEQD